MFILVGILSPTLIERVLSFGFGFHGFFLYLDPSGQPKFIIPTNSSYFNTFFSSKRVLGANDVLFCPYQCLCVFYWKEPPGIAACNLKIDISAEHGLSQINNWIAAFHQVSHLCICCLISLATVAIAQNVNSYHWVWHFSGGRTQKGRRWMKISTI